MYPNHNKTWHHWSSLIYEMHTIIILDKNVTKGMDRPKILTSPRETTTWWKEGSSALLLFGNYQRNYHKSLFRFYK